MLNILGKTKDDIINHLDLVEMEVRKELPPQVSDKWTYLLPTLQFEKRGEALYVWDFCIYQSSRWLLFQHTKFGFYERFKTHRSQVTWLSYIDTIITAYCTSDDWSKVCEIYNHKIVFILQRNLCPDCGCIKATLNTKGYHPYFMLIRTILSSIFFFLTQWYI